MTKKKSDDGYTRSLVNQESALHVYISSDLHYRFAVLCVQLGIAQKDVISDFLKVWLKENEQKKENKGSQNKKSG